MEDYEKVVELCEEAPDSLKEKIKKAKVALKRAGKVNYYKVLGVGSNATDAEIKKSYKRQALKYHPDRMSSKSEEEKAVGEAKFKAMADGNR